MLLGLPFPTQERMNDWFIVAREQGLFEDDEGLCCNPSSNSESDLTGRQVCSTLPKGQTAWLVPPKPSQIQE